METLAQFHFQTVHFPIALSFAAWLLMLVGVLGKKENFFISGRMVIYLASLGAIVAMSTGLMAEEYLPHSHAGEIHSIMEWHETLGITLTCVLAVLSLLCFWESRKNNSSFRFFLALLFLSQLMANKYQMVFILFFLLILGKWE